MPKIIDHNRYRKELLDQCFTLFAEQGYGAVTMRQIAEGLNVSTGTLYHYFPNKEGIFVQLVQELCEKDIAAFFDQAPTGGTLKERLRAVMNFFLANYGFYQRQLLLWVDFHQHAQRKAVENADFMGGFWQRTRDQLVAYLQLPVEQVDFLLVFMDGLLLQCLYGRGNDDQHWIAGQTEKLMNLMQQP